MPKPNPQNLDPVSTKEEARKRGAAGGKKSGETKRRRKAWKETLEIILNMTMKEGKTTDLSSLKDLSKGSIAGSNLTINDMINIKMVNEALKGNTKAYEYIRDQIGEKPTEVQPDGASSALAIYVKGMKKKDEEEDEEDGHQDSPPS
jgi:hypothetical protein